MSTQRTTVRAVLLGGALLAAGGVGFLIARSTTETPPPPAPAAAATQAAEPQELKLDPSYMETVGIKTEAVTAGNLSADVLAPATVTAAPNGEAVVTAHAAGTIVRLSRQMGDAVRLGETLALVESREAATMTAEQSVAVSKAELARSQLAREQELFNQRVTPRQDLERAQAELAIAEAEVRRAREAAAASHVTQDGRIAVVSPLAGRITAMRAALGTFVQPDTELFRIADPRFVQIEASVTAIDADRIAIGDAAKITTSAGARIDATVRSVSPTLDEQTRAATIVLSLMGDHGPLSPGEAVQADITPKNMTQSGVTVPEDAVQNVGGRAVVFVRTADGFKVRPVVTGARGAGRVSVASGLAAGETIATTNAFFLKAELAKSEGEAE
jgi:cobalt-zinc-cadmium efflux system membrane fusion protein